MKNIILITTALLSFAVAAFAQQPDAGGWTPVIELHEVTTVFVSYKVEESSIKLKYEWEFSRHRGSTEVFHDLTFRYLYSLGPTTGSTHSWIPAKAVIKGWTRSEASKDGFNDDPDHHPMHTTIVNIPVAGDTKGIGTARKFCWQWTSERYGNGPLIKPEEGIVYKNCFPTEKDDYDSDDPSN